VITYFHHKPRIAFWAVTGLAVGKDLEISRIGDGYNKIIDQQSSS
jgi:hypothetical protein